MKRLVLILTLFAALPLEAAAQDPAKQAACQSLARLTLPNTTITTAESVPPGGFTPPAGRPGARVPAVYSTTLHFFYGPQK